MTKLEFIADFIYLGGVISPGGEGGGHSHIRPIRVCATAHGIKWLSGSGVLNRVYNFTIERLEHGFFRPEALNRV